MLKTGRICSKTKHCSFLHEISRFCYLNSHTCIVNCSCSLGTEDLFSHKKALKSHQKLSKGTVGPYPGPMFFVFKQLYNNKKESIKDPKIKLNIVSTFLKMLLNLLSNLLWFEVILDGLYIWRFSDWESHRSSKVQERN